MSEAMLDIYTQALRTEFTLGYDHIVEPTPIEKALKIIPSKGRAETYPWLFPPPLLREWQGFRRYAKLGEKSFRVANKKYDAGFSVPVDDLDDDQIGGLKLQASVMGKGAQVFKRIEIQRFLATGQTVPGFDGTNFFATTHDVGTGNNIVTGTTSGSDGVTHAMVVMITTNPIVTPLLWQDRKPPMLMTDAGTIEADKIQMVKWWTTMRGAPFFGFWWDAILVKFAHTPTLADMLTTLGTVNARFRSFLYPKNQTDEPDQFIHNNLSFSTKTALILTSNLIEHVVRSALTLSRIATTDNYFVGWADLASSGYLNNVV